MTFEECGRGRTGWDTYSKEDREIVKHFWDGARDGMVSIQAVRDAMREELQQWCPNASDEIHRFAEAVLTAIEALGTGAKRVECNTCSICGAAGQFCCPRCEKWHCDTHAAHLCRKADCTGKAGEENDRSERCLVNKT